MPWPLVVGFSLIGAGVVLMFITAVFMVFTHALDGIEEELD